MPLFKSGSKKAFEHNVKTEMHAGKPQAQSLAIAYALKRKAKKHAHGGFVQEEEASGYAPHDCPGEDMCDHVSHFDSGGDAGAAPLAEGIGSLKPPNPAKDSGGSGGGGGGGGGIMSMLPMLAMAAAHGGEADEDDDDMVGKIMKQRYSEGGMVANEGEDELDHLADGKENEFDDLAERDELEFHETGANSGDELGDAREDHDREDMVSRIMKSRKKKDRLPNPR